MLKKWKKELYSTKFKRFYKIKKNTRLLNIQSSYWLHIAQRRSIATSNNAVAQNAIALEQDSYSAMAFGVSSDIAFCNESIQNYNIYSIRLLIYNM